MEIVREKYLNMLISRKWNRQIKVITGIRRCGKSYLLKTIFKRHLLESGVAPDHIVILELDQTVAAEYRNPLNLAKFIRDTVKDKPGEYYLFIDEIQDCEAVPNPAVPDGRKITFYDVLNEVGNFENLDVYVTGSNSKMLATDVLTEFRGRGDEVRVRPLSFSEWFAARGGDERRGFQEYAYFGGMPLAFFKPDEESKSAYLKSLFAEVYLRDIVERRKVSRPDVLANVLDFLSSGIGSLTNANNVANVLRARYGYEVSVNTIDAYLGHLEDAFLFSKVRRYDIKGRTYFDYPNKYYCEDVGLRNARVGFRHQEITHLTENVIYNELRLRGYDVDVGVVSSRERNKAGKYAQVPREIDFVINRFGERLYVQSAWAIADEAKLVDEYKPFSLTGDSFRKVIVREDVGRKWYDDNGVLNIGLYDFLLDSRSLD